MTYVTIDGPASSGKSSVARELAKGLDFEHLDTGALYRTAALLWLRSGKKLNSKEFLNILEEANFSFSGSSIKMNEIPLGDEIRTPEVGKVVSQVAEIQGVRTIITQKTRDLVRGRYVVVEGRDIGTVVLPDACVKIFLTASVEKRAMRRYDEFKTKGVVIEFEDVVKEIQMRDKIDSNRRIAPLKSAPDAITFDTDDLSLQQVVDKLHLLVLERMKEC